MHVFPSEARVISMSAVNLSTQQGALHSHMHTHKVQNIWHRLGKSAAILTSHSLSGDVIILSTEPTKANIYPALRAEPGGSLSPSWLEYGVNTGHIPSLVPLSNICILIFSNFTYYRGLPFSVMTFITMFPCLSLVLTVHTKWIHTPV